MSTSKTFCVRAFQHLQVKNNGYLRFCCDANPGYLRDADGNILSAIKHSIKDIDESPALIKIRREMLAGSKPVECNKCWETENSGATSLRQLSTRSISNNNYILNTKIKSIELRLGNLCNLKCRMCNPGDSSKWGDDYMSLYGTSKFSDYGITLDFIKDNALFKWHEDVNFIKWFGDFAENIEEIIFVGGEPLLSTSHLPLLKYLIGNNFSKNIALSYTTNLTSLSDELFYNWRLFREVRVFASIDGYNNVYDYIRFPAKWSDLSKALKKVNAEVGLSIKGLTIQPTPNVYNILNLELLARWVIDHLENTTWTEYLNFQESPRWQSAYILPDNVRLDVSAKIQNFITELKKRSNSNKITNIISWFDGLSKRILIKNWSHLSDEFLQKNNILDKLRKQNLEIDNNEVYKMFRPF